MRSGTCDGPRSDTRPRSASAIVGTCNASENPLNVVGTVPYWGDKVLLCLRNIEPRWGKWTLPAGFMELGESTAEGLSAWLQPFKDGAAFDLPLLDGQPVMSCITPVFEAIDRDVRDNAALP